MLCNLSMTRDLIREATVNLSWEVVLEWINKLTGKNAS